MTYIIPDDIALKQDYERSLRRSGRPPAMIATNNGRVLIRKDLVNRHTGSPLAVTWQDPRGPGNASLDTRYIPREDPANLHGLGQLSFRRSWLPGLGAMGDAVQDVLDTMTKDVKQKLIQSAAINAAITISLNAIPIVGTAMSLVYAGVQAIVGSKYQRESQQMMGDFQDEMKRTQASYQAKIDAAANAAMQQEAPAAQQLALSNLPLQGLDGMGDIWSKAKDVIMAPVKEAQRVLHKVLPSGVIYTVNTVTKPIEQQIHRAEDAAFDARDTLTGRSAKTEVEESIDKARKIAVAQFEATTKTAIAEINSPAYRQQLRINIAKQIRADPSVAAMLNRMPAGGTPQLTTPGTDVAEPAKGISLVPMGAAAAAVLAFGFLKG
jgi:hypothetical protein